MTYTLAICFSFWNLVGLCCFFHFYKKPIFLGRHMKNHPTFEFYTHLCILNIKILIHNDILLLLASSAMSALLGSVLDCFFFFIYNFCIITSTL